MNKRFVIGAVLAILVTGGTTYIIVMLRDDSFTREKAATVAIRTLAERTTTYAREVGYVPAQLADMQEPEVLTALSRQLDHAEYSLKWVPLDRRRGLLIAFERPERGVSKCFIAEVNL
jgi:hypothetical protein